MSKRRLLLAGLFTGLVAFLVGGVSGTAQAVPHTGLFGPTHIAGLGLDVNGSNDVDAFDDVFAFYGDTAIVNGGIDCNAWGPGTANGGFAAQDNAGTAGDGAITVADDCTMIAFDGTADGLLIQILDGIAILPSGLFPTVFNAGDPDNPDVSDSDFAWQTIGGLVDSNGDESITSSDCHIGITHTDAAGVKYDVVSHDIGTGFDPCEGLAGPGAANNGKVDVNNSNTIDGTDDDLVGTFFRHNIDDGVVQKLECPTHAGDPRNQVVGTPFDDILTGTPGNDIICGLGGHDTLLGIGGNDVLDGGAGNDVLNGGDGNDEENGDGDNDRFDQGSAANGADALNGGADIDLANYGARTGNVNVSINGIANDGAGELDNVAVDVENATTGSGNDTVTGSSVANVLRTLGGNDDVNGLGNPNALAASKILTETPVGSGILVPTGDGDALLGGAGDDTYRFGSTVGADGRNDFIDETGGSAFTTGGGTDTADYSARVNRVFFSLNDLFDDGEDVNGDNDATDASDDADNIGTSIESFLAGPGGAGITGTQCTGPGTGNDTLNGTAGPDIINGLGGDDIINGLGSDDIINGNDGLETALAAGCTDKDTLNGGAGNDTEKGDQDTDTFNQEAAPNGGDSMSGGTGIDLVNYAARTTNLTVTMADNTANDGAAGETDNVGAVAGGDIENIDTGSGADNVTGTSVANVINLNGGGDTASGGSGGDTINGGPEGDTLNGDGGADALNGDAGDDTINGGADADTTTGGDGNDTQNGDGGNDTQVGGEGNDNLNGGDGDDCQGSNGVAFGTGGCVFTVATENGADIFDGGAGNDIELGGDGGDEFKSNAGNDFEVGANGSDNYRQGSANDGDDSIGGFFFNDAGVDFVDYSLRTTNTNCHLTTDGNSGETPGEGDNITSDVDNCTTGTGNDDIDGNGLQNTLNSGAGNDNVQASGNDDAVNAGTGNDVVDGSSGNDVINGGDGDDDLDGQQDNDQVNGEAGNDPALNGGDGDDAVSGGAGNDTADGDNGQDDVDGIDGDDDLNGGADEDEVDGGTGNDSVDGDGDDDELVGGDGNDELTGDDGDDDMTGGAGNDTGNGGPGADVMNGDAGADTLNGDDGSDTVNGGTDNDTLHGNAGTDTVNGGSGNDQVFGDSESDTLNGNDGDDFVNGGDGVDLADLGAGNDSGEFRDSDGSTIDTITLGPGADDPVGVDTKKKKRKKRKCVDNVTDFNKAEGDRLVPKCKIPQ